MADGDFRSAAVVGRGIRTTDVVFGADPAETDLAEAARSDTLAEVIGTIFTNPPAALTDAQQAALRTLIAAALVVVNPADIATDAAVKLNVNGTVYSLPDDVADVTDTGLPALTAVNYRQIFIDHDTPRVWVGHREINAGTPAQGDFPDYAATDYRGALGLNGFSPPNVNPGQFWYDTGLHTWRQARVPDAYAITVPFSALFPDSDWLGEQPDDPTAAGLVDSFDAARSYYYYATSTRTVRVLTNSSYVAAVAREVHYTAEPISSPSVVGTITGLVAGAGLTGGGQSGVVTVDIDPSESDFPVIPVDKGGTGAATAAAALAALGGAALASPTFTGTPAVPTAGAGTDSAQAASTAFVAAAVAALINGAPDSRNTLLELSEAINLRAPLASPALTGIPTAPTAGAGTSTTQIASTAFVAAAIAAAMLGGGSDGVLASADYDDATEELVLTLSTGTVIRVPLMALVAGFVTETTFNQRVKDFYIPPSGVGGTGGAITLTTGLGISLVPVGDRFHFIAEAASPATGVTIAVDGGTPAALRKHGGNGGASTALLEANDIRSGFPVVATWNGSFFDFALERQGDAVLYNVGTSAGRLATLGTGGRFADARIPETVARLAGAIFTGAAGGIDPTADEHFVTLRYFNANSGGGGTMHDLLTGWSTDTAVDDAEAQTGAESDTSSAVIPTAAGSQYLWVWRADADGGDPSEVHIAGGGNIRNTFGTATPLTVDGTAGQLIVSVTVQNAALLSGETLRVV